jgi:hypothetical protein
MIISDLNYLEEVNQEKAVVGGTVVTVDKAVNIDVGVTQDYDVTVDLNVNKDINATLDSVVSISGNFANLTGDVTATGNNTFSELDFSVITTGGLSEVSVSATSASA